MIDADIAYSASERTPDDPTPRNCRNFLDEVWDSKYCMVITPKISKELDDHASGYALNWLARMGQKSRLCRINREIDDSLRDEVEEYIADLREATRDSKDTTIPNKLENMREAMLKDVHLIGAAMASDMIIASGDTKARNFYRESVGQIAINDLAILVWVNPKVAEENCIKWLKDGAKPELRRQLGFKTDDNT